MTTTNTTARLVAYVNENSNAYLLVRTNEDSRDFLTMGKGTIDLVNVPNDSDVAKGLKARAKNSQNLGKHAKTLMSSVLPKTANAMAVLQAVINDPDNRDDYVTGVVIGTTKKTARKEKKTSERNAEGTFTLADLAKKHSLSPREVRAKFRKLMSKPDAGWVFTNDRLEEITQLMKGKAAEDQVKAKPAKGIAPKAKRVTKAKTTKRTPIKKAA